ncbi:hypothetical protein EVAR_97420_1 [Eumeta japonica]|uniref:Uncharacterized protein n=1 Tax=Eumeta variegata TaxID=151549 RepID=A0A4C1X0W1_EUMVA|nr:hypothetical protein EVAR_97420_1 [Eumeta japonica]
MLQQIKRWKNRSILRGPNTQINITEIYDVTVNVVSRNLCKYLDNVEISFLCHRRPQHAPTGRPRGIVKTEIAPILRPVPNEDAAIGPRVRRRRGLRLKPSSPLLKGLESLAVPLVQRASAALSTLADGAKLGYRNIIPESGRPKNYTEISNNFAHFLRTLVMKIVLIQLLSKSGNSATSGKM